MEARRARSPEVGETLRQTMGRILSIAVVHEFLSRGDQAEIDIREVCSRIVAEATSGLPEELRGVRITLEGGTFSLPAQQATSCALAVNELLQNSIEHAFVGRDEGAIRVVLDETDASMVIRIVDDGIGLPPGFDATNSPALGLRIVHTLVQDDLHGQLLMSSAGGTTVSISFPKELCCTPV
jgi:two-component sensor histidine kinase